MGDFPASHVWLPEDKPAAVKLLENCGKDWPQMNSNDKSNDGLSSEWKNPAGWRRLFLETSPRTRRWYHELLFRIINNAAKYYQYVKDNETTIRHCLCWQHLWTLDSEDYARSCDEPILLGRIPVSSLRTCHTQESLPSSVHSPSASCGASMVERHACPIGKRRCLPSSYQMPQEDQGERTQNLRSKQWQHWRNHLPRPSFRVFYQIVRGLKPCCVRMPCATWEGIVFQSHSVTA